MLTNILAYKLVYRDNLVSEHRKYQSALFLDLHMLSNLDWKK